MIVTGPSLTSSTAMSAWKAAGGNPDIPTPGALDKILVQRQRGLDAGGGNERRPPALATVAVQGELRHDQQLAIHVAQGMVEFAVLVRKKSAAR